MKARDIPPELMANATVKGIAVEGMPEPKRSKYRAVRTEYNGVMYDSAWEAERARHLDLMRQVGMIRWWLAKPKFRLGVAENVYVADALVFGPDGEWVEDTKGVDTPKFRRDVRLWKRFGPCELHIVRRDRTTIVDGGQMTVAVREPERKDILK